MKEDLMDIIGLIAAFGVLLGLGIWFSLLVFL